MDEYWYAYSSINKYKERISICSWDNHLDHLEKFKLLNFYTYKLRQFAIKIQNGCTRVLFAPFVFQHVSWSVDVRKLLLKFTCKYC